MLAIIGEKNEDISSYLDKKDSKQKNNIQIQIIKN